MDNTITPIWMDFTGRDAAALRSFYADLFGWTVAVDEDTDYGLLSTEDGASPQGGIGQVGPASPQVAGYVAYFPTDDLEQSVRRAVELGGSVVMEPWTLPGLGTMALVTDPEGNRVGLMTSGG